MDLFLQTERLTLRPFNEADALALQKISNQPQILKWMPDWEATVDGTRRLIQYAISQYPLASRDAARLMFAVEHEGELIGMVGVGKKKEVDNEVEIAYFLSAQHTGQGLATEAVGALAGWALPALRLPYLIAIVEPDNQLSQRVVEKCGFKKVDTRMILNSGEREEKPFFYYRRYQLPH